MEKLRLLQLQVLFFIFNSFFLSCNSNSDTPLEEQADIKCSILGVWESNEYFISFSEDNFYVSYLDEDVIDSGDYIVDNKNINCKNTYYNRNIIYTIKSITETTLDVQINYVDFNGNSKSKNMKLTKSSIIPTPKDNPIIGKSYSYLSTSALGTITWTFNNYNTGDKTASKRTKYPIKLYYIYLDNKIYVQQFKVAIQMPVVDGWGNNVDNGEISIHNVKFYNGQIIGLPTM